MASTASGGRRWTTPLQFPPRSSANMRPGRSFVPTETAVPTETERAMPAWRDCNPLLDDIAGRFPDQRAICEDPDFAAAGRASRRSRVVSS